MPGALLSTQRRAVTPEESITLGPPPSWSEQFSAQWRVNDDDSEARLQSNRLAGYQSLEDALVQSGQQRSRYHNPAWRSLLGGPETSDERLNLLWSDLEAARARDPKRFATIPKTRDEFELWARRRQGGRDADQLTVARGDNESASLAAGLGIGLRNGLSPENILFSTMGFGGKTVASVAGREFIGNALIAAGDIPETALARAQLGETLEPGEAATNVILSGAGGAALGTAARYGAPALKAAQEKLWAKILPHIPEAMRPTMHGIDDVPDAMLADISEQLIGADALTPDQRAAIGVLRRTGRIEQGSPFDRDAAGAAAHGEELEAALAHILGAPRTPSPRARLTGGTALSSGSVPGGGIASEAASLKARIGRAENASGSNSARPIDPKTGLPLSSALGRYQFTSGTWVRLYKSRYGAGGLSDAQIAARRTDPALQEVLMDDLISVNARALARAGQDQSAGNLYLAHFAGPSGAVRLLEADPRASARSVLGDAAVNANRFLERMSASDVIAWAHRKMGGAVPETRARATALFSGDDPLAAIDAAIEANRRDMAQLDAELNAPDPRADDGVLPDPIGEGDDIPVLATPIEAPRAPRALTAEQEAILPRLTEIARDGKQSLNLTRRLARELDVDEDDLAAGLAALADRRIIRQTARGTYARIPRDDAPQDVLTFIARNGGIRDDEGHALGLRSPADTRGMVRSAIDDAKRKRASGRRDLNRFIPGAGPLLRHRGRSIDEIGELLHEAGYIGTPDGPRPTVNEVLQLIEGAANGDKKVFRPGEEPQRPAEIADGAFQSAEHRASVEADLRQTAADWGFTLDAQAWDDALRLHLDGETLDGAVLSVVSREIEGVRAAAYHELGDEIGGEIDDEIGRRIAADGGGDEVSGFRSSPDAGDAGARGARGSDADAEGGGPLDAESAKAFDDPDGPAAEAQAESLAHDARALTGDEGQIDPEIAKKDAQEAQLGADAPMKPRAEQEDIGTSLLFDDSPELFVQMDVDGAPRNIADVLSELDDDATAIKNIRDCL